jgi:hypothetical protein
MFGFNFDKLENILENEKTLHIEQKKNPIYTEKKDNDIVLNSLKLEQKDVEFLTVGQFLKTTPYEMGEFSNQQST